MNEQYLRKHPEVAALISSFVRYVQILVDVTSNFSIPSLISVDEVGFEIDKVGIDNWMGRHHPDCSM